MKNLLKLSALAAVLVASATYASAAPITLTSAAGTGASHTNGALEFNGFQQHNFTIPDTGFSGTLGSLSLGLSGTGAPTLPTSATFAIGTGTPAGTWGGPIPGSTWVSFNGNTAPGGSLSATNGYYEYETDFLTTGGALWSGSLNILADDTVDVFLNGTEIETSSPDTNDGHCSNGVPSCTGSIGFGITITSAELNQNGNNQLVFVVEQTGDAATGLDFSGSISQVPEPSTLLMLGTGLLGSAGALFRRMRK